MPGPLDRGGSLRSTSGVKPEHVAVEVNKDLVTRARHAETAIADGRRAGGRDAGRRRRSGGARCEPLTIGTHTVPEPAVRRDGQVRDARADARLPGGQRCRGRHGRRPPRAAVRPPGAATCSTSSTPQRYTILPNTAGCFSAEDALRTARLGRELLEGLDNPGADWVKLEVLADPRTLLPDPVATLEATAGPGQGRLPGPLLHERRPGHGPPAQGGRGRPASCPPAARSAAARGCSTRTTSGSSSRTSRGMTRPIR